MNIEFHYFIWGEKRWHILLFSIISLKKLYKLNKIKVFYYTEPPDFFISTSRLLDIDLIKISSFKNYLLNKFEDESNPIFKVHKNLIYKLLNCLDISCESNKKIILLDCDILFISQFSNINWEKISLYFNKNYVNTGVLAFDTSTSCFLEFKKIFKNHVINLIKENFNQINYIKESMGKDWLDWRLKTLNLQENNITNNKLMIQEEIIVNSIFKKNKKIFHNIGIENNGIIFNNTLNNIHMMNLSQESIYNLILNINYFKKLIDKFIFLNKPKEKPIITKEIEKIIYHKKYLFL